MKELIPNGIKKIHPIIGNITEPKLGISVEDRKLLIKKINFIFHSAASVRFDDPLDKAIKINVRGTREVCQLALEMENLEVYLILLSFLKI